MTLDILISTYARDGIERLDAASLPTIDNVNYVISWQSPQGDIPSTLRRDDIKITTLAGKGLSRNRNNSISASDADICMIADDDLTYNPDGIKTLIKAFEANPQMDVALVKSSLNSSKIYPDKEIPIFRGKFPKGYYILSFEIAFRRSSLPANVRFDTRFGLGAEWYLCGEEEIFVDNLLRAGLHCRFIPVVITSHPHPTTASSRLRQAGVQRAMGAVIFRLHPLSAILRLPLKAWRISRAGGGCFLHTLWNVIIGAISYPFIPNSNDRK